MLCYFIFFFSYCIFFSYLLVTCFSFRQRTHIYRHGGEAHQVLFYGFEARFRKGKTISLHHVFEHINEEIVD